MSNRDATSRGSVIGQLDQPWLAGLSACAIDSQSVKTTGSDGRNACDTAKRIKDRKRHILTGALDLMLDAVVHTGAYAGEQFAIKVAATAE